MPYTLLNPVPLGFIFYRQENRSLQILNNLHKRTVCLTSKLTPIYSLTSGKKKNISSNFKRLFKKSKIKASSKKRKLYTLNIGTEIGIKFWKHTEKLGVNQN